ncbi:unnamed protein product [Pseudo-nitzschia multistriata]|uniref:Guanylate cyclase domain-containing protein n=1 Tax=Pseudo-nitzschia multistriata TaxID=183589 RepID=A0A448ZJ90_9STRA|nr:unnamed protein product [Pseudo-nitzschia multistriata]
MFQVQLLLCLIFLTLAQAESHYIRGETVNPASRIVNNNSNGYHFRSSNSGNDDTTGQRSTSSRPGMNNKDRLQRILEFQAVKKFSGSQPTRKTP